jgi:hypothetical protein
MDVVLVLVVVAVVVLVIAAPLRRRAAATDPSSSAARAELDAAREAKFREIRDAELDYRTGKLSRDDWRALDSSLRAEAVEILRRLDSLDARTGQPDEPPRDAH